MNTLMSILEQLSDHQLLKHYSAPQSC